jgi:hypothetical protein
LFGADRAAVGAESAVDQPAANRPSEAGSSRTGGAFVLICASQFVGLMLAVTVVAVLLNARTCQRELDRRRAATELDASTATVGGRV